MHLFFSVGESSGDMHGASLIQALKRSEPTLTCEGLGGRRMAAAGMDLRHDLAERAIMGFSEVIRSLGYIRSLFRETVEHLKNSRPDGLVVIDYPGFNIRLAKKAKSMGIPVIYYISPQVWAWKKGRIHTIARIVEKMLVILPFEAKLYADLNVDCKYVGHPLLDHIGSKRAAERPMDETRIGLLPGSRAQEIDRILPTMISVARGIRDKHPGARFTAPCVDEERCNQIGSIAGDFPLDIVVGKTYDLLGAARFCLVASGTATLETALFKVPMVVLYKVSPVTYWLARTLVRVDAIAMVNILAEKKIVPEYIQGDATLENILPDALKLISDTAERKTMIAELEKIRDTLGEGGASENAAREILEVLGERARA